MNRLHTILMAGSFVATIATSSIGRADFHFWYIKEIFSNHDGSVQFVELFTTAVGQQNLAPFHSLTSSTQSFPFPNDSPTPTNNRHMLIATSGFGAIPGGATPNYIIPPNFFNPSGDTINFGEGTSIRTFNATTPLPIDGIESLNWSGFFSAATEAANSPRNHAGEGSSVDLSTPIGPTGDYNENGTVDAADYTLWRDTLGNSVTPGTGADGDESGTIDQGDYAFWKSNFGTVVGATGSASASSPTVPEPSSAILVALLIALHVAAPRRRQGVATTAC